MASDGACCPEDSTSALPFSHKEAGKVITLDGDLQTYVVGSPDSKAAVLVTYDIFGFAGQSRIRLICDDLAALGFYVVLPDYYRGDQITGERFALGMGEIGKFIMQFKWDDTLAKDVAAALAHARSQPGVRKVGMVGFCWGVWVVMLAARSGDLDALYGGHPSLRIQNMMGGDEVELVKQALCPAIKFDTAGNDPATIKAGGEISNILTARTNRFPGGSYTTREFADMEHGFITRGPLDTPAVATAVKSAIDGMHTFLTKELLGAPSITLGASKVTFQNIAREWRCKYIRDESGGPHNSASLAAAEALLQEYLPTLKALPSAKVQRVVCGGCGDFKVIISQPAADHKEWGAKGYAPEVEFLEKLRAIDGVSQVEEQTFTLAEL